MFFIEEPACEVSEKGTTDKNDGNGVSSLDDNEKVEVYSDEVFFAVKFEVELNRTK